MSGKFDVTEYGEVSLKGNVYDFLDDCNVINKFDILNIHKYLDLLKKMFIVLLSPCKIASFCG